MPERSEQREFRAKGWELNVLLLEAGLAAAGLMAAVFAGIPKLLQEYVRLPQAVWMGLGLFVLFWALYPVLNVYSRGKRGRELPARYALITYTAGAVLGGVLFAILR